MTTDNRTNEPTDEQVEAAAKVIRRASLETTADPGDFWSDCYESEQEAWRESARAALVAAQGAAPRAESEYEYILKARALHQTNAGLPSSGVDEDKLAEVIARVTDLWDDPLDEVHDIPQIARAVAEWLKGQGR